MSVFYAEVQDGHTTGLVWQKRGLNPAEVQDGHTTGLVWQKRGLNPPLSFITANLTMIGDERSSFVIA